MPWVWLLLAAACEIAWVAGLRSLSTARPLLSIGVLIAYVLSLVFLARAVQTIPLGVGYAIWTGLGVLGAFALGAIVHHDRTTTAQALFAALILVGVAGLFLTGAAHHAPPPAGQTP
ncbi:MAG: multidrug efflux SMR transporter [Phycisphaerales bacterium]